MLTLNTNTLNATANATDFPAVAIKPATEIFSVAASLNELAAIRTQASDYHVRMYLPGRKEKLRLLSAVYSQYYAAKISEEFEQFANNVRSQLTNLGIEVRKSSLDSSNLVRYVFADFDDKQVHVCGRSLDIAYELRTLPGDFVALVEKTDGGLDGLRKLGVQNAGATSVLTKQAKALSEIDNDATVKTLEITDWADGEEFRVMVAVRNEDDTADLKDTYLSEEARDKVILAYLANKEALKKQGKKIITKEEQAVILQNKNAQHTVELQREEINSTLEQAKRDGNSEIINRCNAQLVSVGIQIQAFSAAIKALKANSAQFSVVA